MIALGAGCSLTAEDVAAIARAPDPKAAAAATVAGVHDALLALRAPSRQLPSSATALLADNARVRALLLDAYFRGAPAAWRQVGVDGHVPMLVRGSAIEKTGYRVEPVRFETVAGLWVPAVLYTPTSEAARPHPAVLSVIGHGGRDNKDIASDFVQARAITLARQGLTVLSVEWFDQGQLRNDKNKHDRVAALEALGVSGTAPFLVSLRASLAMLAAEPNVDPQRIAMVGLSGGGWQTLVLSALDERIAAANPVAGFTTLAQRATSERDMGDWEQSAWGIQQIADFDVFTQLISPRYLLLTYNAKDECCFRADRALPPLLDAARPAFSTLGASTHLKSHVNEVPGTHNMERDNREAFYQFLSEAFSISLDIPEPDPTADLVPRDQLRMPLPKNNLGLADLVDQQRERVAACRTAPDATCPSREAPSLWPTSPAAWVVNERARRSHRRHTIRELRFAGDGFAVDATVVHKPWRSGRLSVVLHDKGRDSAAIQVADALANGDVAVVDLPFFGSASTGKNNWLQARQLACVGASPLGVQRRALAAVVGQFRKEGFDVDVIAEGRRSNVVRGVAAQGILPMLKRNYTALPEAFAFGIAID